MSLQVRQFDGICYAVADSPPVKVTVLLTPDDFSRFDDYCKAMGFKKSTLIARLVREHLDAEKFQLQKHLPLGSHGSAGR